MNPTIDQRDPYQYYKPDDSLIPKIQEVREAFAVIHRVVENTPPTRERAIAITKLEEAAMWAIKGIVLPPLGPTTITEEVIPAPEVEVTEVEAAEIKSAEEELVKVETETSPEVETVA